MIPTKYERFGGGVFSKLVLMFLLVRVGVAFISLVNGLQNLQLFLLLFLILSHAGLVWGLCTSVCSPSTI